MLANILGVLGIKSLGIEVTHTFPFSKFSDAYQFTEKPASSEKQRLKFKEVRVSKKSTNIVLRDLKSSLDVRR